MKVQKFAVVLAMVLSCVMAVGLTSPSAALATDVAATASFRQLLAFAQASASANQPATALSYYVLALHAARTDETQQRVALFGIGHMLLWLGRYGESERVYRQLLASNLSSEDRQTALAGLVESLSYDGRPMVAYAVGSSEKSALNQELVIATAEAATDANWPDKARELLNLDAASLGELDSNSRLAAQLRSVRRAIGNDLGPLATLDYTESSDSDGLRIDTADAQILMPAGTVTAAYLLYDRSFLAQNTWSAQGDRATLGASSRLGDHTWVRASFGSQSYPGWQTGTYDASASLRPNDRYGFEAFGSRDIVETQTALAQHLTGSLAGFDGDSTLGQRTTGFGEVYRENFSDGNRRIGLSGKVGLGIDDSIGLSGAVRWRSFSDNLFGSNAYFDPWHYGALDALITETRRLGEAWRFSVTGGLGRQGVDPGDISTTESYEASMNGYSRGCVSGQAVFGYSNSALASSSGYQRHYTALSVNCTF
jgi:tetratricopeptide (TPR) repeat protein